jgi:general secretion pathway protein A
LYEKFYGFREKPFQIVPNPKYLYLTSKHQNALTYLEYGLSEGAGFILLTGEIGTGKTTLIRYILNQIESDILTAVIFNTNVTADQLICLVLQEFELVPADDKAKNLDLLYQYLISKFSSGKRVLLIIDEAQNLSVDALEEVRMLSNLQSDEQALLQVMLVGQPELKDKLKSPRLAQFSQRIAVNYHLTALSRDDTKAYIASRLQKAGGNPDIFTEDAVERIFQVSKGTPRTINIICDSALVYGFADELEKVTLETVEQVIEDKGGLGLQVDELAPETVAATGEGAAVALAGTGAFQLTALEKQVHKLQMQMDFQLEQLEERALKLQEGVISRLTSLIEQERKQSDRLLRENTILRERYKLSLQAGKGEKDEPPPETAPVLKSGQMLQTGHRRVLSDTKNADPFRTEAEPKKGFLPWLKALLFEE